jgi:hydrogenase maturation protein HypF
VSIASREARRFEVRGVVQGVGFRPFVWRMADRHRIAGWVRNRSGVVEIHAEGDPAALEAFASAIATEAPPLARVDDVTWAPADAEGLGAFAVDVSVDGPAGERLVSPDAATCEGCLAELLDPVDRRYRYPFINCTDCGPRFTIIEALPYDRERTSMRTFPMCPDCRREYEDPADRRFHAEPVACSACGPRLTLLDAGGAPLDDDGDVVARVATMLETGAIVALKGLGGFHLACDATDEAAVARLRARKGRLDKPFAVMVRDLDAARAWFDVTDEEATVLASWRAPIVLVADGGRLAPGVAPGHRRQGAMLPSTPLHHLLLRATDRPLVMTSGNATDEPICIANDEALTRLTGIADAFIVHDREIVSRYDDPVSRVRTGDLEASVLRRARSFAPSALALAADVAVPTLGTGAELHGAFCLAIGRRAFLSQHIGDLDTEETMAAYRAAYERYRAIFRIEPELVAHDLHPDFMTTRFAEELGMPRVAVQHHHAHVAATMAEHGLAGEVLGVAFDGLGLGDDGTIWGGELLRCDAGGYVRAGRLRPVRQPGGDAATRHPWRMAIAHTTDAEVDDVSARMPGVPADQLEVVRGQLRSGLAAPWTTSAGRLFDAVAALLGVCTEATYEGQPAMLLEQIADAGLPPHDVGMSCVDGLVQIDTRDLIAAVLDAIDRRDSPGAIAGRFHASLAAAVARACSTLRDDSGLDRVVLGGGVFHNDLFTSELTRRLTATGFTVFCPREVPVGDGGIALGQVLVANARREAT